MRAGFGVDELGVDAHAGSVALHRSFEHVTDAKLGADRLGVEVFALEAEGRVPGDDETVGDARQIGGQVLGDPVGEIILGGIVREVGEGQHDDREMPGLGRRGGVRDDRRGRVCRDGGGAVRGEPVPSSGRHREQQRNDPDQREQWTFFQRGCLLRLCRRRLRRGGLRLRWDADLQRIDSYRLGDVLELGRAEIDDGEIEPRFHLPVGVLGKTDRARFGDPFQPGGDIDAVAHQVAVALFDDVAQMNADAELDAAFCRHARVALDHGGLHFDRAAHRVDHAAKLDDPAIAGALHHASMMNGNGRIDQVAAQRPQTRERAVFIRPGEPAVADHVGDKDRRNFAGLAHGAPLDWRSRLAQ